MNIQYIQSEQIQCTYMYSTCTHSQNRYSTCTHSQNRYSVHTVHVHTVRTDTLYNVYCTVYMLTADNTNITVEQSGGKTSPCFHKTGKHFFIFTRRLSTQTSYMYNETLSLVWLRKTFCLHESA